ncbi:MAG: ATP-binding protein [Planctomycetota bacterium]
MNTAVVMLIALVALVAGFAAGATLLRVRIARRLLLERRDAQAERAGDLRALTSGLAHEIKNPLSTIGLNAQLLDEAIRDQPLEEHEHERLTRRVDVLRREAERLRDILEDFLKFADEPVLDRLPTDLNTIADELVDFFLPSANHQGVRLRAELCEQALPVSVDASKLKQAALNLLLNAAQAMEQDERSASRELIIRTAAEADRETGEPFAALHVIDTGPGIPSDVLPRIFEPYFTTKPKGVAGGTGLGLAITRRLIEAHNGRIDVVSETGRGTDFTISIPLLADTDTPPRR